MVSRLAEGREVVLDVVLLVMDSSSCTRIRKRNPMCDRIMAAVCLWINSMRKQFLQQCATP